jgi:hypothetical protein
VFSPPIEFRCRPGLAGGPSTVVKSVEGQAQTRLVHRGPTNGSKRGYAPAKCRSHLHLVVVVITYSHACWPFKPPPQNTNADAPTVPGQRNRPRNQRDQVYSNCARHRLPPPPQTAHREQVEQEQHVS